MNNIAATAQASQSLIGVQFKRGIKIDEVLADASKQLNARGLNVAGLVQVRGNSGEDCDCQQMYLRDLTTGISHAITENRGALAQGCHLDRPALMSLAQSLESSLNAGTDVLILNRFGQSESEGRGFRGVIERAMDLDIVVIIAYRDDFLAEWRAFEGGLATTSSPRVQDIVRNVIGPE